MYDLGIIHGGVQAVIPPIHLLCSSRTTHANLIAQANILVDKHGTPRISGFSNVSILPHSTAWEAEGGADINWLGPSHVEFAGLGLSPNATGSTQPAESSDMYYAFGVMAFEVQMDSLNVIYAVRSLETGSHGRSPLLRAD